MLLCVFNVDHYKNAYVRVMFSHCLLSGTFSFGL